MQGLLSNWLFVHAHGVFVRGQLLLLLDRIGGTCPMGGLFEVGIEV